MLARKLQRSLPTYTKTRVVTQTSHFEKSFLNLALSTTRYYYTVTLKISSAKEATSLEMSPANFCAAYVATVVPQDTMDRLPMRLCFNFRAN